jgi:nitrate reductase gamma subunit
MYQFVTGPLAWIAFGIFLVGMIIKVVSLFYLARKKDKVVFNHFSWRWSLKSIVFWLIPFGSRSMREKPVFTAISFAFHICLLTSPIFLLAHNLILEERWGIRFWSLPETVTDVMTVVVIVTVVFLILRRISLPDVRIVTTLYDYLLLTITVTPFITGFIAYHQFPNYKFWLIVHIVSGEIMLISIPFTRLSHIFLFFMTRAHIGSEMGQRRGALTW